jgi:hypothetical protein
MNKGRAFRYVKNFSIPGYEQAAMFLSTAAGVLLLVAMTAAMNRSIQGKEAR